MNLQDKTLLLMGGGAYAAGIKKYRDEKGFRIVALGRDADTPIAKLADAFYHIDTQDVDSVCDVVKKEGVNGIFVGSSEVNIHPAIEVARRTGAYFYTTRELWDVLADKAMFKECCRRYGVPTVPQYDISRGYTRADVEALPFPVLIKPTDSSGARGLNVCNRVEDFDELYDEALRWSKRGEVIVEKLIVGADETFFQYTIQDGVCSLTSCFTKVFVKSDNKNLILPLFHMYPSKYIDAYYEKLDENVKTMFRELGVQNGVMTLQCFCQEDEFYVFEAGFRMGGAQNYIFSEYQNGNNSLEYMLNYAMTGSMADHRIADTDNARFPYPCCNYYVGLKPGVIGKMDNVEEMRRLPGVLNITVMSRVGDAVLDTNALERICLRIHVVGETVEDLARNVERISKTLSITSTSGEDMQLEPLTYERCLNSIRNTVKV